MDMAVHALVEGTEQVRDTEEETDTDYYWRSDSTVERTCENYGVVQEAAADQVHHLPGQIAEPRW